MGLTQEELERLYEEKPELGKKFINAIDTIKNSIAANSALVQKVLTQECGWDDKAAGEFATNLDEYQATMLQIAEAAKVQETEPTEEAKEAWAEEDAAIKAARADAYAKADALLEAKTKILEPLKKIKEEVETKTPKSWKIGDRWRGYKGNDVKVDIAKEIDSTLEILAGAGIDAKGLTRILATAEWHNKGRQIWSAYYRQSYLPEYEKRTKFAPTEDAAHALGTVMDVADQSTTGEAQVAPEAEVAAPEEEVTAPPAEEAPKPAPVEAGPSQEVVQALEKLREAWKGQTESGWTKMSFAEWMESQKDKATELEAAYGAKITDEIIELAKAEKETGVSPPGGITTGGEAAAAA